MIYNSGPNSTDLQPEHLLLNRYIQFLVVNKKARSGLELNDLIN